MAKDVGKDTGATGALYITNRNEKWYSYFEKQFDNLL